jgi:hypothetical protein
VTTDQIKQAARDAGAIDIVMNGYEHWSIPNTTGFLERFAREILRQAQQPHQYVEGRRK